MSRPRLLDLFCAGAMWLAQARLIYPLAWLFAVASVFMPDGYGLGGALIALAVMTANLAGKASILTKDHAS